MDETKEQYLAALSSTNKGKFKKCKDSHKKIHDFVLWDGDKHSFVINNGMTKEEV